MSTLSQNDLEKALQNEDTLSVVADHAAKDIANGSYDISAFVEQLGFALTSPIVDLRVSGTKCLSLVLANLPKDFLNVLQIEFLTTFYVDRLKDHHNVIPAVIDGIEALISMKHLPHESITKLLKSFFEHTSCQSQLRNDRAKLFSIFKYLYERYPEELKSMSGDFIYGLINSIDGERDPRNLDFIFSFMPSFISTMPLDHLTEDMFEIFACYFPIDFNPSKNDPETITRDNLAQKLCNCLVASPEFVEWTVSLALEKLESELIVAKLDSLELLYQAALKFEPKAMTTHFEEIWTALKKEIFPGTDNADIVAAGLKTLRGLLEQAGAKAPDISHNYQTIVLGTILSHLSDVNQRLFNPSTAISLVCISGDAAFAGEKILNTFLLKLNTSDSISNEQRIQIYTIIAQIFKIISLRNALEQIDGDVCMKLHADLISSLRCNKEDKIEETLDMKRAALSVLNECTPIINEVNRALIYRELVYFIAHETINLEFTHFLEQLGALHPIELQSHLIDVCIRNFPTSGNFVQEKIFNNLLPLVKQIAFTERIMDLLLSHIFDKEPISDVSLSALKALNTLLTNEDNRFITHLQHDNCLIDKLIALALERIGEGQLNLDILQQISVALSLLIQQLDITEQYIIASEYIPKLNMELASNLFVAKGILTFLHKDISLDDQFECLLKNLIKLSLESNDALLRQVAHNLACSLVNKIELSDRNREIIAQTIISTKIEISQKNAKAVEVLSWLAKGLIVRGFEDIGGIIETLNELLDDPSLATSALLAFEVLSAEYPQLHLPNVKYLYKQKLFHIVLHAFGKHLEAFSEPHLNAFVYTLKATPHTVIKFNIEKIGPILFKSLESTRVQILCTSLEICEYFIKQQDEYFRSHLNHLVPSCLRLATFRESMNVRITALNLLYDITKYPVYVLLPHKMDVVLELSNALNDSKRLVRSAAVRASNSWFLIGAPNTTP